MEQQVVRIAEYTKFPGGRYIEDGEGNATLFRTNYLLPPLRNKKTITVELDGVSGYPSSFLDEAFGGLVREEGISSEDVLKYLHFHSEEGKNNGTIRRIIHYIKSPDNLDWKETFGIY